MSIQILFEDNHVIAINKPSGLIVHGDGKHEESSVVDWLLNYYPDAKGVGDTFVLPNGTEINRSGVVHRLDKETSGVLLLAKTQQGFDCLKKQFQERTIEKTYHAFVFGNIKEDERLIDAPIGRSAHGIRKWTSGKDMRKSDTARDAETCIKVLHRGKDKETGEPYTFVEAKPKTGRTHQIRVHLNYIGRPIIGDSLYTNRTAILGFERVALHARAISFVSVEGETVSVDASHPEDFETVLNSFEK